MEEATILRVSDNNITAVYVTDKLILLGYQDGSVILLSRQSYSTYDLKLGSNPVLHITKAQQEDEFIIVTLDKSFILQATSLLNLKYREILKNYKKLTCIEQFQNYYIVMQLTNIELYYPVTPIKQPEYNESLPGYRISIVSIETEKIICQTPIHAAGGTFKVFRKKIIVPCSIAMEGFLYYQYGIRTKPKEIKKKESIEQDEIEIREELAEQKALLDWFRQQRPGDYNFAQKEVPEIYVWGQINPNVTLNYLKAGKTIRISKQTIHVEDGRSVSDAEEQKILCKNGSIKHKKGKEISLDCTMDDLYMIMHNNTLIACQQGVCAQFSF